MPGPPPPAEPLPHQERAPEAAAGERLDRFLLTRMPDRTRSAVQNLIEQGGVLVNQAPTRAGYRLRTGDLIAWRDPVPRTPVAVAAEEIPLAVVYDDDHLLVVDKPKGLVMHPAPGNWSGTLINALLARVETRLAAGGGIERPGLVHRLDRDTSGLLVVARTDAAYQSLQRQIQERSAERRYMALVRGNPKFQRAVVDAPIGRHPKDRKRMAVIPAGSDATSRTAVTELEAVERFPQFALLEARLQTGRTHQIRVHCAHIGHPVVGDPVYGPDSPRETGVLDPVRGAIAALDGQALHAYSLAFTHPATGGRLRFTVPPPPDMLRLLDALGARWRGEPR